MERGTIVVIEAPEFFRGKKLAAVINKCKHHDDAIECDLLDDTVSVRKVCVGLNKSGDRITLLSDFNLSS